MSKLFFLMIMNPTREKIVTKKGAIQRLLYCTYETSYYKFFNECELVVLRYEGKFNLESKRYFPSKMIASSSYNEKR